MSLRLGATLRAPPTRPHGGQGGEFELDELNFHHELAINHRLAGWLRCLRCRRRYWRHCSRRRSHGKTDKGPPRGLGGERASGRPSWSPRKSQRSVRERKALLTLCKLTLNCVTIIRSKVSQLVSLLSPRGRRALERADRSRSAVAHCARPALPPTSSGSGARTSAHKAAPLAGVVDGGRTLFVAAVASGAASCAARR